MTVRGLNNVMRNLNRQIEAMPGVTQEALNAGALVILRESQRNVPVDTGNLRQSGTMQPLSIGMPATAVFYTAEYAVFVHEDMEAYHPSGESKFLEKAVRSKQGEVVEAMRREARVRRR